MFCHSIRRPTSGSSSSCPPRAWGNSMLGANQLLPMFLTHPLIQLTHPGPSQVISSARGRWPKWGRPGGRHGGHQVPFSKERRQVQGPLEGSFMRGTGQANTADP